MIKLNGNWEEKGVIGTRIEISGNSITILWRNSPVLITKFKTVKDGNKVILELKDNELRNAEDEPAYATVSGLYYEDEKLTYVQQFNFSGESTTVLEKVNYSRYGDYTIVDDILKELKGEWTDDNGYFSLVFKGNELTINNGIKIKVHVLLSNSGGKEYLIVDEDPNKYSLPGLQRLNYFNNTITTREIILDADSKILIFKKK